MAAFKHVFIIRCTHRCMSRRIPNRRLSSSFPYASRLGHFTNAYLKDLPRYNFSGKTCMLYSAVEEEECREEIEKLTQADVIGFDTEGHGTYRQSASLVQLSTDDVCIMWKLRSNVSNSNKAIRWLSPKLKKILESPNILKVGHGSRDDAILLLKAYNWNMGNFYDTQFMTDHLHKKKRYSLSVLVGVFLNHHLFKGEQSSNWDKPRLRKEQIEYAATDAWASLKVYQALVKHMEETGVTCEPPIKRTWSLLKPNDKAKILNRLSNSRKKELTQHSSPKGTKEPSSLKDTTEHSSAKEPSSSKDIKEPSSPKDTKEQSFPKDTTEHSPNNSISNDVSLCSTAGLSHDHQMTSPKETEVMDKEKRTVAHGKCSS